MRKQQGKASTVIEFNGTNKKDKSEWWVIVVLILPPSALQRLRGWDDVDAELSEMHLENQSEKAEGHLTVLSLLSQRSLRWQLVSIIIMNMGQQLSGVNAVRRACPVVLVSHALMPPQTQIDQKISSCC